MLISGKLFHHTLMHLRSQKKHMLTLLLGLSAVYMLLGGFFGLWYPNAWVLMDFNLFYEVGGLAWDGINPYTHKYGAFAYPPAWVTLCAVLSLLPWWSAVALWKLLNLFFLGGCIWLSSRLFDLHSIGFRNELVFCFSCLLWPTLTTLNEGQTSLFILFFLLCSILFWHKGNSIASGAALCLSLMKPQLSAPLFILFVWRRQLDIILFGLAFFLSLSYIGLLMSNASLNSYFKAIIAYAAEGSNNDASRPYNVGMQNLSATLFHLSSAHARYLGVITGVIFLVYLYIRDRGNVGFSNMVNLIPLILLIGLLFFGARSYDLVLVIPFFAWLLYRTTDSRVGWVGAVSCLALFVPLKAVKIFYRTFLSSLLAPTFFELVLKPFRSWVLVILLVSGLTLYLRGHSSQCSPEGSPDGSPIDEIKPLDSRTW